MTTKNPGRYFVRLDGDTLIVRDEATYYEYTRALDAALCDPITHPIFRMPGATQVLSTLIEKLAFTIVPAKCSLTAQFRTGVQIPGTMFKIEDTIDIECMSRDYEDSKAEVARLESKLAGVMVIIEEQTSSIGQLLRTVADLTARITMNERFRALERKFGAIPRGLVRFAEAVLATQDEAHPFACHAMALHAGHIWLSPSRDIDISGLALEACGQYTFDGHTCPKVRPNKTYEQGRGWPTDKNIWNCGENTCLLWVPTTIAYIDGFARNWRIILPEIRATRIIIGPFVLNYLLPDGAECEPIRLHPSVRSIAILSPYYPDRVWKFLRPVLNRCELILPETMRDQRTDTVALGTNIRFFKPTEPDLWKFCQQFAETFRTWNTETIAEELARSDPRAEEFARLIDP